MQVSEDLPLHSSLHVIPHYCGGGRGQVQDHHPVSQEAGWIYILYPMSHFHLLHNNLSSVWNKQIYCQMCAWIPDYWYLTTDTTDTPWFPISWLVLCCYTLYTYLSAPQLKHVLLVYNKRVVCFLYSWYPVSWLGLFHYTLCIYCRIYWERISLVFHKPFYIKTRLIYFSDQL